MKSETAKKLEVLLQWFSGFERIAIAYSGGLDSSFLLAAADRLTELKVCAISVHTPYVPDWEMDEARTYVNDLEGVRFVEIALEIPEAVRENPEERCYLCKRELFSYIQREAGSWGGDVIVDGSNTDDTSDYRPGMRALRELGIRSPLLECGFSKEDIREVCREWGLPFSEKPAYSCLLTRIPHDTEVSIKMLRRIESAERCLHVLGFPSVRVRVHGDLARIEIGGGQTAAFSDPELMKKVYDRFREIGYRFVTLDLQGYVMGKMNRTQGGEER